MFVPATMVVLYVLSDHCFNCPVRSLHGVALRCVRRGGAVLYPEFGQSLGEDGGGKLRPVIREHDVRATVAQHYLFGDDSGGVSGGGLSEGRQFYPLREAVLHHV